MIVLSLSYGPSPFNTSATQLKSISSFPYGGLELVPCSLLFIHADLCVPMFFFNLSVQKPKRLFAFFEGKKEKDKTMIILFFFLFCLGGQIEPPYYLLLTDRYQRKSTVLPGINHHFLVYKLRCHLSILFCIKRDKWRVEVVSIGGR